MTEAVHVVLDTSVFTNPDSYEMWDSDRAAALAAFTERAMQTPAPLRFYMPPTVFAEMRHFFAPEAVPPAFELVVSLQAPDRHGVTVPGFLLYKLIEEMRARIDKGLRVAEKAVRDAHPERVEDTIHRLRAAYRKALRSGLVDSQEDVDLILLVKQLGAALVSCDAGVNRWAEDLGIRLLHPEALYAALSMAELEISR